jgi:F-type H+-transporting ATPase subunit a
VHTSLLPLVYSLFWIVLGGNLLGNVPYSYALTTSLSADLGLSAAVWVTSLLLGAAVHRTHFVAYFAPSGTPLALLPLLGLIELISFVARAVSLGVREFANIVAGHTLLAIATSFIAPMLVSLYAPIGLLFLPLIGALIGLELAVAVMQAYVLTVLTCSYLRDALELH